MKIFTYAVPIKKDGEMLSVLLECKGEELYCISVEYQDEAFLQSVAKEIEEGGTLLQDVLLQELAAKNFVAPFEAKNSEIEYLNNCLHYYFPVIDLGLSLENKYRWVSVGDFDKERIANKQILARLIKKLPDLSTFAAVPTEEWKGKRIVAFDAGGVLFEWNDERFFQIMGEVFSCTPNRFGEVFLGEWCRRALHIGERTQAETCAYISERLSQPSFEEYVQKYFNSVCLIKENVEVVQRLKDAYPDVIFILTSNTNPIIEYALLRNETIRSCFSNYFMSWRMKMVKPNKEFYQRVMEVMGEKDIFFVDDSKDNVNSAIAEGWQVYHTETNSLLSFEEVNNAILKWLLVCH